MSPILQDTTLAADVRRALQACGVDLTTLSDKVSDVAVPALKTVPGVGEWTAQYIALRGLRFPDAFPAGDLGLQKAASGIEGGRLNEAQLLARAAAWAPWRGYAALLLWHGLH